MSDPKVCAACGADVYDLDICCCGMPVDCPGCDTLRAENARLKERLETESAAYLVAQGECVRLKEMLEAVEDAAEAHITATGICDMALEDDPACYHHACTYCNLARALQPGLYHDPTPDPDEDKP